MYVTVASYKGGVGKTTTAVHIAGYLQKEGATLLIDGDPNRSATMWSRRKGFSFQIADERGGAFIASSGAFRHIVIDTEARPESADFESLARNCDVLVIPSTPGSLDTDALIATLEAAQRIAAGKFRVLLTRVPPPPDRDGAELRAALVRQGIPVFESEIPRLKVFEYAAAGGILVSEVIGRHSERAWEAYQSVGREVIRAKQV